MREVRIIEEEFQTMQTLQAYLKEQLKFPDYYGMNLGALHDALTDIWEKTKVYIVVAGNSEGAMSGDFKKLIRVFLDAEADNPELEVLIECKDCTEAEQFVYDRNYLYSALVESTDDYIYVCNMETGTFCYPQSMVEEFDLPGQVIGNALEVWKTKIHENDWAGFLAANKEIMDGLTESHSVEYRAKNKNGEWLWLRCRGHLERNANGEQILFAGIISNLGKKNKIDHLTGLHNRFEYENKIDSLLNEKESPFFVLKLDIDDFRRINHLYGQLFGDEVIRIIAQRIESILPVNTMAYRLYGDEFAVIFRGDEEWVVQEFYGALQKHFSHQQEFDGKKFSCNLSGGCASAPKDAKHATDLITYADCALNYAKHRGKSRMEFFTRTILEHNQREIELTEILRESMENGYHGFSLHYQPVMNSNRKMVGTETLARFYCEKYGNISPAEFIPLLEESGLILDAGKWIFEEAIKTCSRWLSFDPEFLMSVNISCLQLEDESQSRHMDAVLKKYNIGAEHIIVEATESHLAENLGKFLEALREIQNLGISVSMDDFGTGYSSLGILKQAPFDIVKIDQTFIKGIQRSRFDFHFIQLVVELCHTIGIKVCIEGVEEEEEYREISGINLDYLQGYLFSRPLPEEEFERSFFQERQLS